jgi:hypothetical protein
MLVRNAIPAVWPTGLAFLARTCQVPSAMNYETWSHLEATHTLLTVDRGNGERCRYDAWSCQKNLVFHSLKFIAVFLNSVTSD